MNRPSARTNFPNRPSRRSRSRSFSSPPRLHRSRARSRSPTATSPEARTCPIRVPCHHAAIHSSAEQDYRAPFNRARVHWISAKARVAAFVHVCSPTATRFSPTPPSFSCSCSSSCSFSIPYRHQPRSADLSTPVCRVPCHHARHPLSAEQDYRATLQSCLWSLSCSSSLDISKSKSTRRCLRSRLFSHSEPLFTSNGQSSITSTTKNEHDSGSEAMNENHKCAACPDASVARSLVSADRTRPGKEMLARIVAMLTRLIDRFDRDEPPIRED